MDNSSGHSDEDQQCNGVDSRFPLEAGMHLVMGVRLIAPCTKEHFQSLRRMKTTSIDWFVITYPKSGTTWLQEITWLLKTNGETAIADSVPVFVRVPLMEMPMPGYFSNDHETEELKKQVLLTSHLPAHMIPPGVLEKKSRIIIVHRDPRDVAVSLYSLYCNLDYLGPWTRGWDAFLEMFLTGNCLCGDWFAWTKGWWGKRKNNNNLQLRYEWIKKNHREAIIQVAKFLDKDPSSELVDLIAERTTFEAMESNPMSKMKEMHVEQARFIKNGTPGAWKEQFTVAQSERFVERFKKEMKGYEDLEEYLQFGI